MHTPPCTIHERDLSSDSSCRGLGLRVMENVPVTNVRACFWGAARQNSHGPQGARRFNIAYHNIMFLPVLRALRRLSSWTFYTHKTITFNAQIRLLSCGVLTCHPDLHTESNSR